MLQFSAHVRDGEWGMAARAAGVLEEVDSPARTARHENAGWVVRKYLLYIKFKKKLVELYCR